MLSEGYGGHFVRLSVCSINISPVGRPEVKVMIIDILHTCQSRDKLFILCEILSLSRYDNFKSLHSVDQIGHFSPCQLA